MKLTNKLSGRSEVVGLALGVLFCFSVGAQESFEIARNAAGKPDFSGITMKMVEALRLYLIVSIFHRYSKAVRIF